MRINTQILKKFEGFTKDNLDYLINYKKTYVRKQYRDIGLEINQIQKIVKNYDISNFKYDDKGYGIFIYPDTNFINILKKLDPSIDNSIFYYISVTGNMNQVDFAEGIPPYIRGLGVAYKLYKLIIDKNKFITSDRFSTLHAWNLWYNLLQDEELYCITSEIRSVLISKKVTDQELTDIINKVKVGINNIEYDDDLKEKLKIMIIESS